MARAQRWILFASALLAILLPACDREAAEPTLHYSRTPRASAAIHFRLAPHPFYNPQHLSKALAGLVAHLERRVPQLRIDLETSRDYQSFERKVESRSAEMLMPNPWQAIQAMKVGYHVIAMWGDPADFKGLFLARRDSPIHVPDDLRGKIVSYPAPTALAAAVMPQGFLHARGLDIHKDIVNHYVGSQESSIMNAYLGQSDVAATWPPSWRLFQKEHPAEAAQLQVLWETPPLINNAVMLRDDVEPSVREALLAALLELRDTPSGREILADMETAGFRRADDATYDVVRAYVAQFERDVRLVEQP